MLPYEQPYIENVDNISPKKKRKKGKIIECRNSKPGLRDSFMHVEMLCDKMTNFYQIGGSSL